MRVSLYLNPVDGYFDKKRMQMLGGHFVKLKKLSLTG